MNTKDVEKPINLNTLLEFPDEVLLPRISDLIDKKLKEKLDEKFEESEGRMATKFVTTSYLDEKLADQAVVIIERLERRFEKERSFTAKVTEILKKSRVAEPRDIEELERLMQ